MITRTTLTILATALAIAPAWAHHSFSAVFDVTSKVTISGMLVKIDWRNPHVTLLLEVPNGEHAGAWRIESMPPTFFRTRNVTKADFENAMGKVLTITASRARDGSAFGLMEKVTLPDGRSLTTIEQQQPAP